MSHQISPIGYIDVYITSVLRLPYISLLVYFRVTSESGSMKPNRPHHIPIAKARRHYVIVGVRDPSHPTSRALQDLPVGKGSKLITVKPDFSVPSDAAAAVAALKGEHGIRALDIVIANAGIASDGGRVRDTTVDNIRRHFEVNTISLVVPFQAVADLLQASKTGKPLFVAISTLIGSMGSMEHLVALPPTSSPYGGSKAALNWFIRRLHFEEPWLTSFVIHPGLVETDMAVVAFGSGSTEQLSVYGAITVETSVTSLVNVIDKASKEFSGTSQNYDGTPIAWWTVP